MRALVVGIGALARDHYVPWLADRPGIELALLPRTPGSAADAAARYGARALDSWQDAAAFDADVAFNVSTDTQHAAVLDALIDLGVPRVLTEKPLVSAAGQEHVGEADLADGLRLARRACDAGVEIAVGFNYRFFRTVQGALDTLAEGGIGSPANVVADTHHACLSHTIDLIGAVCGPLAEVAALERPAPGDAPASRVVSFTAVSGVAGTLAVSSARSWGDRLFTISVLTERGRVAWSDLDADAEHFDAATGYRTTTAIGGGASRWDRYAASFAASLTAFVDAAEAGRPSPVGIDAGLRELQVEAAVVRSLRERRPVAVQEEFPLGL